MKEITKTTVKRYDKQGNMVECTETIVEKETIKDNQANYGQTHPWYGVAPSCETGGCTNG